MFFVNVCLSVSPDVQNRTLLSKSTKYTRHLPKNLHAYIYIFIYIIYTSVNTGTMVTFVTKVPTLLP
jgi:hypothetical protein